MSMIFAIIYFSVFVAAGLLLARFFFAGEGALARITLGICFGLVLNMWMPALWSFVLGFTLTAQIAALGSCFILAAILIFLLVRIKKSTAFPVKSLLSEPVNLLLVPLLLFTLAVLYTHTLLPKDGGLYAGQSTFGDMAMHLGFITSISVQQKFPPSYSILAGAVPLGYPFLCDSISSTYYTLTGKLRFSYILPMVPALIAVMYGVYILLNEWLSEKTKAIFGAALFFVGGGFGFAYFFDRIKAEPGKMYELLNGFYKTPTNLSEQNVIWVNVIADLLIPQRATLFGWAVLLPALFLLHRAAFGGERKYFIALGILGGSLPLIHTHSFLALAVISAVCMLLMVKPDIKSLMPWLAYAAIAFALAAPQIFAFTLKQASGDGFLRLHFNWANKADNYFWFYVKNIGLVYLLAIPAFIHADEDKRKFYCGGLALLLISEFIVFQPNEYDNNKLLYVWFLLTCGLTADFLLDLYRALKGFRGIAAAAALVLAAMNTGGVLTLAREVKSEYLLFESRLLPSVEFIKEHTAPAAVFLTSDNHNNVVAALTGRNIFCGSGSYLFFHGVDYREYYVTQRELFEQPSLDALRRFGVDYVYVSEYERARFDIDERFLAEKLDLVYGDSAADIYRVPE